MNLSRIHTNTGRLFILSQIIPQSKDSVNLRDYSSKDKAWDKHKAKADQISKLYKKYSDKPRDDKRALKIKECAGWLSFARNTDGALTLVQAHFCHSRACSVCQWRRSIILKAKFYANIPEIIAAHPTARFIFLTLTVKNVPLSELRATLQKMSKAFNAMTRKVFFKQDVLGYVRNVEVTRNHDTNEAHPHFHILLAVKSSYYSTGHYYSLTRWRKEWQEVLGVDYLPQGDIQNVRTEKDKQQIVKEMLKYPLKESDIPTDSKWYIEYCEQVHRLRFISTGGILKDVVKDVPDNTSDEEMIHVNESAAQGEQIDILEFSWNRPKKKYQRTK